MISPSCPNCKSRFKTSEFIRDVEVLAVYDCGTVVSVPPVDFTLTSVQCLRLELTLQRNRVEVLEGRVNLLEVLCAQLGTAGDTLAAIVDRDYRDTEYTSEWYTLRPEGKKP